MRGCECKVAGEGDADSGGKFELQGKKKNKRGGGRPVPGKKGQGRSGRRKKKEKKEKKKRKAGAGWAGLEARKKKKKITRNPEFAIGCAKRYVPCANAQESLKLGAISNSGARAKVLRHFLVFPAHERANREVCDPDLAQLRN